MYRSGLWDVIVVKFLFFIFSVGLIRFFLPFERCWRWFRYVFNIA